MLHTTLEPRTTLALAHRLNGSQQAEEVLRLVHPLLELRPNCAAAWYQVGWALQSLSMYRDAEMALHTAVTHEPAYALAHLRLASLLERRGQDARAMEHLMGAIRHAPQLDLAWLRLGKLQTRHGKLLHAETTYCEMLAHHSDHPRAVAGLARVRLLMRDLDGAYAMLAPHAEVPDPHPEVAAVFAEICLLRRTSVEALLPLDRALPLAPGPYTRTRLLEAKASVLLRLTARPTFAPPDNAAAPAC